MLVYRLDHLSSCIFLHREEPTVVQLRYDGMFCVFDSYMFLSNINSGMMYHIFALLSQLDGSLLEDWV